jgi:hypothetical protein
MKMESFVMPAWMAGIHQVLRIRPETSMSPWIPALHAGMTELSVALRLTEALHPFIFEGADTVFGFI